MGSGGHIVSAPKRHFEYSPYALKTKGQKAGRGISEALHQSATGRSPWLFGVVVYLSLIPLDGCDCCTMGSNPNGAATRPGVST